MQRQRVLLFSNEWPWVTSSQFNQDTLKFDVAFLQCNQIAKVKTFEPFLMNGLIIKSVVFVVVVVVVVWWWWWWWWWWLWWRFRQTWDSRTCFSMGTCSKTCIIAVFLFTLYTYDICIQTYTIHIYILLTITPLFLTGYTNTMFFFVFEL